MQNILDSIQNRREAFTSPLTLGCRGLFPRCLTQTGQEAGHSPPSADVKNECRSTSTPPHFIMARYIIRYIDRPGNLSRCHHIPQQENWGNTACQTSTAKNDSVCMILNCNTGSHVFVQLLCKHVQPTTTEAIRIWPKKKQNQLCPVYVKGTSTSTSSCNKRRAIPTTNQQN